MILPHSTVKKLHINIQSLCPTGFVRAAREDVKTRHYFMANNIVYHTATRGIYAHIFMYFFQFLFFSLLLCVCYLWATLNIFVDFIFLVCRKKKMLLLLSVKMNYGSMGRACLCCYFMVKSDSFGFEKLWGRKMSIDLSLYDP